MLFQLEEDLVHLERRGQRYDQDRRLDRAGQDRQRRLRVQENVAPQSRFEVALHLRQIETWTSPGLPQRIDVVKEEQPEIEQHPRRGAAVDLEVPLRGWNPRGRTISVAIAGFSV